MKGFKNFRLIAIAVVLSLILLIDAQINTACTSSMISSFTPCLNFLTGSSPNGSFSPTTDCCSALKSVMTSSMDCACLIITASVLVQLPVNRTQAISLPRACNMAGVPVQCKSSATPLPAPGPTLLGPSPAPKADSPGYSLLTPQASKAVALSPEPVSGSTDDQGLSPTAAAPQTPKIRPVMTPPSSAATPSYITLPFTLLMFIAPMIFKSF